MTDELRQMSTKDQYAYLVNEWQQTMVGIQKERRRVPVNWRAIHFLEAQKTLIEEKMRGLVGHDPDDDSEPPF